MSVTAKLSALERQATGTPSLIPQMILSFYQLPPSGRRLAVEVSSFHVDGLLRRPLSAIRTRRCIVSMATIQLWGNISQEVTRRRTIRECVSKNLRVSVRVVHRSPSHQLSVNVARRSRRHQFDFVLYLSGTGKSPRLNLHVRSKSHKQMYFQHAFALKIHQRRSQTVPPKVPPTSC